MSISLASLEAPKRRPLISTICADGGMGKTSLAALWPGVVFIRTEDGSRSIENRQDIAMFPVAKTTAEVFEALDALTKRDEHPFATVVIDSVTQFNVLAEQEVIASDPKAKSINTALGGYGAGYAAVAAIHFQLRTACQVLADKCGMHVVFIAHADVETIDLPDQPQFSRYTIRMNKKSVSNYTDNVDIVAFIKLKMFLAGEEGNKKAGSTGDRIITCYPHPAHVSKNRLGIKADLPFVEGVNPFAEYLV